MWIIWISASLFIAGGLFMLYALMVAASDADDRAEEMYWENHWNPHDDEDAEEWVGLSG